MKPDFKAAHVAAEFDHTAPLITCRFDPTGKFVFATAEDRAILRWDLADPKKKTVFSAHDSYVWAVALSKDGQTLVSAGGDDTLIWWPATAEKPEPQRKVTAHKGWIRSVAISPDGKHLASGGNDRLVKLWNLADGKMVQEFTGHELDVYSVTFHPDGKFLLSGDLMGKVHQWDLATGKSARVLDAKELHHYDKGQQVHFGGMRGLAVSPDRKHLACGGLHKATNPLGNVHEPIVQRYDWETHKLLNGLELPVPPRRHAHRRLRRRQRRAPALLGQGRREARALLQAPGHGPRNGFASRWSPDRHGPLCQETASDQARA